ncbi:carbohydrate ABC transporter substrate-binding protein [Bacillus sp. HMF5848]|uniref:ABC transporter substrate-binding protein n=1 Tax=Bacillus sp. HMF5848 TaxID=2495421 RepID=UPI000F76BD9C|nr:ABC transporter substrate-binding protein [Bacillus sp. HMF5848]RSK28341.1 carbohydrate ABC transporter substrate-binding protein [Bacillus sp. HMF5848]
MKKSRMALLFLSVVLILTMFVGCGAKEENTSTTDNSNATEENSNTTDNAASEENSVSGEITVLTNRTDIVDTVFKDYAAKFNEKYPDVKVSFEAITDYEGQVKIRLNTKDYGDVLLIPNELPVTEVPNFFEPLGTVDELSEKYLFVDEKALNNTTYGIPITVNAEGIVYNKRVFEEAGITESLLSPEAFLDAMKKIKENTDAIPYYTNYAAGWPLTQWEPNRLSVAGEPDYVNVQMPNMDDPFSPGRPHYVVYKLMYDLAKEGLIERDPLTTDWESSKAMLAKGEIASMVLGSWAISQVQALADNPSDIGYMPFPSNKDGKVYAASGGDYKIGINLNSKNKDAAEAWLYWFINESNYAVDQGGISPIKGAPMPETLSAFEEMGVELISNAPPKEGQDGLVDEIDKQGEIGLWAADFKARIIEAGIGNRDESYDDIMNDLNARWKEARAKVVGN